MNKTHTRHRAHEYDLNKDLERIKNAFTDASHDVREKANEMITESIENVKEKSVQARDLVGEYVSDQPLKSVGVALICGALIGYFLHRK